MSYLKYDGSIAVETAAPSVWLSGSNALAETLTGTSVANALDGYSSDVLRGGAGDDTYYLKGDGITVTEAAGAGVDRVVAWQNVNLGNIANVENLEIGGDRTYGAGNALDNLIVANGSSGYQLYGGLGQDVLVGSAGADTFIIAKGEGNDAIYGFETAKDVIRLTSGYKTFAEIQAHTTQVGADVKIDLGGSDSLVLRNVNASQLTTANFQLGMDASKLGALTFNDDFNSLNLWNGSTGTWATTFWYDSATGNGGTLHSNNEQQWYINANYGPTASVKPWTVDGGQLTLTVAPATADVSAQIGGYKYTSGEINTFQSFAQTYGYFEMRADVPDAEGAWPAFWLMPTDGSWPPELDVMEVLSRDPNAVWTTAHSGATGDHTMSQGMSFIPETTDGFHTYGVLWTKTDLTWFVDGVEVFKTATPADMNKPMYMMANLALGGWGGAVDNADLPAQFKIDYIRSYALADGSSTVSLDTAHTGGGTTPPATGGGTTSPPPVTQEPPPPVIEPGVVLTAKAGGSVSGGGGADTLTASTSASTLTGGAGADVFVCTKTPTKVSHITDFQLGVDKLDLSKVLSSYAGSNPVADQYVSFASDGAGGTKVMVDLDGAGKAYKPAAVIVLDKVAPTGLTWAQLQGAPVVAPAPDPAPPPPPAPTPGAGLMLTSTTTGSVLVGGTGADTLVASAGLDTLTGGGGADRFVFGTEPWAPVHINDFEPGKDVLDLSALLQKSGYAGTDPVADKYVYFESDGAGGTLVRFDRDAAGAGQQWPNTIIDLHGVSPANLTWGQLQGAAASTPAPDPTQPEPAPVSTGVVLTSTSPGSTLIGASGADTLNASEGLDTLTGGAGADHFVFGKEPWAPVHVMDFEVGKDVLDLSALFQKAGYTGSDPVADKYVFFESDGAGGTLVRFDRDGAAPGQQWPNTIIDLHGVSPVNLTWSQLQAGWIG